MGERQTGESEAMTTTTAAPALPMDRNRVLRDRRRPQRVVNRYTIFGGRRRQARRSHERAGSIPDTHGLVLFVAVVGIAVLNILDAFYTVLFLSHGGTEMNPFVDWILVNGGVWWFVFAKSVGIGVCVAFLTLTKNFLASRIGLAVVFFGYAALLCWHLHLLDYVSE